MASTTNEGGRNTPTNSAPAITNHNVTTNQNPIASDEGNLSNANNNNELRMMHDMEESLRQIEDGLDVNPNSLYRAPSAGRAAFLSMSSALGDLRHRVNEYCETHRSTSSTTSPEGRQEQGSIPTIEENDDSVCASSPSSSTAAAVSWGRQMSERLASAEFAHRTRTPLRRLGSALGRIQQLGDVTLTTSTAALVAAVSRSHHHTSVSAAEDTAREASVVLERMASPPTLGRVTSGGEKENTGTIESTQVPTSSSPRPLSPPPSSASSSSVTSPQSNHPDDSVSATSSIASFATGGGSRRRSTLHASRSASSLLEHRHLELHETGGALARTITTDDATGGVEVIVEEEEDNDDGVEVDETGVKEGPTPMEGIEKIRQQESSPLEDTPILLSESSHAKLDASRRSILFASESSMKLSSAFLHDDSMQVDQGTEEGGHDDELYEDSTMPTKSPSVTVYSWGTGINSLHDDTTDKSWEAAPVSRTSRIGRASSRIASISTSSSHSAVATASGVLVCGNNDKGQAEPSLTEATVIPRPVLMESISVPILQVACGLDHTAALTATGVVLTWGSDEYGQLGHLRSFGFGKGHDTFVRPQAMALSRKRAVAVACGDGFTMVLTTRMEVLCCGVQAITGYDDGRTQSAANALTTTMSPHPLPSTLPELECLPIVSIAAGRHHAAVVTAMGSVLAWGENKRGCCGRASPKVLHVPVPVRIPTSKDRFGVEDTSLFPSEDTAVLQVACGDEHTVLVTKSGEVFVCGANREGQLGLSCETDAVEYHVVPLKLPQKAVNAQAGEAHTLLTDRDGNLWIMGNGTAQLTQLLQGQLVAATAAGGRHSIAIAANPTIPVPQTSAPCRELSNLLSGSHELNGPESIESLVAAVEYAEEDAKGEVTVLARDLAKRAEELLKTPTVLNSLFIDPQELEDLYLKLLTLGRRVDRQAMANAIEHGMRAALEGLKSSNVRLLYPESLRFLLLYIQCPLFIDWDNPEVSFDRCGDVMLAICDTILGLTFEGYKAFMSMVSSIYNREDFVRFLLQPLLRQLEKGLDVNAGLSQRLVPLVVAVLSWLHNASRAAGGIAHAEDFYSKAVNKMDGKDAYLDLFRWKKANKSQRSSNFFICAHSFLFSPGSKRNLLQIENQMEMFNSATADGVVYNVMDGTFEMNPFWVLEVERQQLLGQTLRKIADAKPNDLRKKLRISFKGEEGVDAGGVTREFFQLISAQLFDVNSGMWLNQMDDEEVTWFNTDCFWNDEGYHLVGILVGLAVYNGVLLDVNFPPVVYRKLLGLELGLEDVPDKAVQKSLQQLLDYDGDDVEDVFCLNFALNWTDLGRQRTVELKPGGSSIPVTKENKEKYVQLYVKWLLEESIHAQYDAFERGFMRIMQNSTLDFLSPEELELLVVGSPELDFGALEKNTEYEGGYDSSSEVVRHFWQFVKSADTDTQLKFLKFATGSSKAPIGGLGEMKFKIQRAGPDSMQLPTSHTCFNTLLLPEYDTLEKLTERLGRAILECEGFGLQ